MWVIHSCIPRIRMIGMSQLPYSLAALRTCTSNSALAVAHMTAAAPLRFCSQEGARKLHAGRVAMMLNHMIIIIILLSYWIWYSGKFMNIQTFRLQNGLIQNIQWKIWSTHYGSSEPLELVPGLPAPYASQHPPKIRAILRSSRSLAHRFRDFDNAGEMADFRRHAAGHHPKSHQNKTMAWMEPMEPVGLGWS